MVNNIIIASDACPFISSGILSLSLSLSLRGHAAVSFLMWTKDPSRGGHKIWIRVKRILSAVAAAVVDRQE
jgi:hypothetical protein